MTACLGENTVTDLVDALLAPAQRAIVEAHTAECDSCRRLVSELVRRTGANLAGGAGGTPSLELASTSRPSGLFELSLGPRALVAGMQVGRYVVRDLLGRGGAGAVFAAYDPELARPVALKLLHPGNATQRDRIRHEARALARLAHPNVVAVFDVGELDGDLFLAMELVAGDTLRAWAAQPHTADDAIELYMQAGRGLAAAHAAKLVHRDFKPDNVLRGHDGRVRVIDFGLADGGDGGPELVGTPAYMAPELFAGRAADAASDQFAFCVALYEALFGKRPFAANFTDEVGRGLPAASAGMPALPAAVLAVLARGLSVEPARRFASMTDLLAALAAPANAAARSRSWVPIAGALVIAAATAVGTIAILSAVSPSAALPTPTPTVAITPPMPVRVTPSPSPVLVPMPGPQPAPSPLPPLQPRPSRTPTQPPPPSPPQPSGPASRLQAPLDAGVPPPPPQPDAAVTLARHEMSAAQLPAVRAAVHDLGYTGLTFTGHDPDGDIADLEAKLAAAAPDDHHARGVILTALAMAERRRGKCSATKTRVTAALDELNAEWEADRTDERMFAWVGRAHLAVGLCALEAGHALAALHDLSEANANIGIRNGGREAQGETWLAEGIAYYVTGDVDHEALREIKLIANLHDRHVIPAAQAWLQAEGLTLP